MIDLFYYRTPNARKVLLFLEEAGLPYRLNWVDITSGDQFSAPFVALNLNSKIPVIVDAEGPGGERFVLAESGAILVYLADKTGRFLSADVATRYETLQWVMWQMAHQGPMLGQATHFVTYAAQQGIEDSYARDRYRREAERLYGVLDRRLDGREWLVGGEYSIADMICWPWTRPAKGQGIDVGAFPNVKRWATTIAARPAAKVKPTQDDRAFARGQTHTAEQWKTLFGGAPNDEKKVGSA